ncbi:mannonate dehydratase [Alicyclobacillus dauci]|uniref:Mannonate dehydratase n=1 Tax=Alicyclobacillus dauci TaxID=1475485 RepID=A0ABY6Z225_9BACL|nr:mannonate dehydratase [Alicyclobacillus dauci]WAH36035.1 mannonate dehydratase [Alicyclobacillus dauci]
MKLSFRWYGDTDPVTLEQIRQIPGMQGIVTSLYDVPAGDVWPLDGILRLKTSVEDAGLELTVIESVPVHEDIKMGRSSRDRYIENYQNTLRNLARAGIDTVCYNFMPMFDWLRTSLEYRLPDGSTTLAYKDDEVDEEALLSGRLRLPAWNFSSQRDELMEMYRFYQNMTPEELWANLEYFARAVMPVAKECGQKMTIHPDDPPWPVVGIPRIIVDRASLDRLMSIYDDPSNGICFCSGSLGASAENDLPAMMRHFGRKGRIHFVHLRNVRRTDNKSFYESGHLSRDGSVDMYELMEAMHEAGVTVPVRPDHGRMVWGETGNPGYGLFDRAMGAAYLNGLWEAISKSGQEVRDAR